MPAGLFPHASTPDVRSAAAFLVVHPGDFPVFDTHRADATSFLDSPSVSNRARYTRRRQEAACKRELERGPHSILDIRRADVEAPSLLLFHGVPKTRSGWSHAEPRAFLARTPQDALRGGGDQLKAYRSPSSAGFSESSTPCACSPRFAAAAARFFARRSRHGARSWSARGEGAMRVPVIRPFTMTNGAPWHCAPRAR